MSVDLLGHGDACFSFATWHGCLELALAFGWQPAGTIAPYGCKGPWDGTYSGNDGQGVSSEDARAMAEALYRAVTALKPKQKLTAKQRKAWANEHVSVFSVCHLAAYAHEDDFAIA